MIEAKLLRNKRPRRQRTWPVVVLLLLAFLALAPMLLRPVFAELLVSAVEERPSLLAQPFLRGMVRLELPHALTPPVQTSEVRQSFTVRSGETGAVVARRLTETGLVRRPAEFLLAQYSTATEPLIAAGTYEIPPRTGPEDLAVMFRQNPGSFVMLRVVEGWRLSEIAAEIERVFPQYRAADVLATAVGGKFEYSFLADLPTGAPLEGFLFPDTYFFTPDATLDSVLSTMLVTFERRAGALLERAARARGVSVSTIVKVAALIERETSQTRERPVVSSVYWNRLARRMLLQADPTVQYALGDWRELSLKELQIDSPYNTYRYTGLTPTPICSPSLASLQAAAEPVTTHYLFFVARTDGSGTHVFAETAAQHEANRVIVGNKKP